MLLQKQPPWEIEDILNMHLIYNNVCVLHCLKSVRIRIFSGPYFHTFGLYTERYSVFLRIQSECGKIRTKKTPNMDTFHTVLCVKIIEMLGEVARIFSYTLL